MFLRRLRGYFWKSLREKSYKSFQILQIFISIKIFVRFVKICSISVRKDTVPENRRKAVR